MQTEELRLVRGVIIGRVYKRDGKERLVTGIYWSPTFGSWSIQWTRRGYSLNQRTRLERWAQWQAGAEVIFDMLNGPWIETKARLT